MAFVFLSLACFSSRGMSPLQQFPVEEGVIRYSSQGDQSPLHSSVAHFVAPFLSRRPWGHFPTLNLVPSAVLTMGVQVCLAYMCFGSVGCIPRGLTPVSSDASLFPLKRTLSPASHNDFSGSNCHQVCAGVPAWRNLGQHLWLVLKGPGIVSVHLYFLPWNDLVMIKMNQIYSMITLPPSYVSC
jgi:hypothetical protein